MAPLDGVHSADTIQLLAKLKSKSRIRRGTVNVEESIDNKQKGTDLEMDSEK